MIKRVLILLALAACLCCGSARAQSKRDIPLSELRELVSPGKRVFVVFEDQTGDFDEKDEYIREYLAEETHWTVTDKEKEADFILYVEAYSKKADQKLTSKTYYMTPTVRRPNGKDVWTGETVCDWANLANGLRAVRGVSWKLVMDALKAGLEKELGDNRVLLNV